MTLILTCLLNTTWAQPTQPVLWLGVDKAVESSSHSDENKELQTLQIDFQISGGLMLVQGIINGRQGNFIFDTGSPALLVNDPSPGGVEEVLSLGLHQLKPMRKVKIEDFSWAGSDPRSTEAYSTDLQHLEDITQHTILGVIGFEGLQPYEVRFDLHNKAMHFRPGGQSYADHENMISIPFRMAGHIPVIELTLGGKKLHLGLDTGASVNVMDNRSARSCKSWIREYPQDVLISDINKNTTRLKRISASQLKLQDELLQEMSFCVTDLSSLREMADMPIDGLLGLPFFRAYDIIIDFEGQVLYLSVPKK